MMKMMTLNYKNYIKKEKKEDTLNKLAKATAIMKFYIRKMTSNFMIIINNKI